MKTSILISTAIVSATLLLPLLPKAIMKSSHNSNLENVAFRYEQSCDFANDPSGCKPS